MGSYLLLPVRMDALVLREERVVVGPRADHSRLPWFDGTRDVNSESPWLGSALEAEPFREDRCVLPAGVHLHWALPDALCRARQTDAGSVFPAVPNRWLVTRTIANTQHKSQWVVESDFLHQPGTDPGAPSVVYPMEVESGQPWRHLGRQRALSQFINPTTGGERRSEFLDRLTAIGPGDPAFAASYPNCRSVFGYHDARYGPEDLPAGLRYDLLGWYARDEDDAWRETVNQVARDLAGADGGTARTALHDELEERLGWSVRRGFDRASFESRFSATPGLLEALIDLGWVRPEGEDQITVLAIARRQERPLPADFSAASAALDAFFEEIENRALERIQHSRLVCHACVEIGANAREDAENRSAKVALGHSGLEAVGAWLVDELGETDPDGSLEELEAITHSERLEDERLDQEEKVAELRHEQGFEAVPGGSRWSLRFVPAPPVPGEAEAEAPPAPARAVVLLDALQILQNKADVLEDGLSSQRRRIHSDWSKWMMLLHAQEDAFIVRPDLDAVRHAISVEEIGAYDRDELRLGEIRADIERHRAEIEAVLTRARETAPGDPARGHYELQTGPGERYWQPSEPVVMIQGGAAARADRHGRDRRFREDGLLEGIPIVLDDPDRASLNDLPAVHAMARAVQEAWAAGVARGERHLGFHVQESRPWTPLRVQWELFFHSRKAGGNRGDEGTRTYSPQHLKRISTLPRHAVDRRAPRRAPVDPRGDVPTDHLLESPVELSRATSLIVGESHLTGRSAEGYRLRLEAFLRSAIARRLHADAQAPEPALPPLTATQLDRDFAGSVAALEPALASDDPLRFPLRAWRALNESQDHILTQRLSGFHEALLMHREGTRVSIEDPLAFAEERSFNEAVASRVGDDRGGTPLPQAAFHPLRAGAMEIERMRLVDSFGLDHPLISREDETLASTEDVIVAPSSRDVIDFESISLPPRFVTPTRLEFRFHAARTEDGILFARPGASAVCGWVVPDHLNRSLLFFDFDGRALGRIDREATWRPAPGEPGSPTFAQLLEPDADQLHPALARVVEALHGGAAALAGTPSPDALSFLAAFQGIVDSALDAIRPEDPSWDPARAFLMGRPLAVVRARLELREQGLPAVHQGFPEFEGDLVRRERETNGYEHIEVPVRLGAFEQHNDGLVGFWIEQGDRFEGNTFFATRSEDPREDHDRIVSAADSVGHVDVSIGGEPVDLTLLLDPRGRIHLNCGVLPTKIAQLPNSSWQEALDALEPSFAFAPLLTLPEGPRLSLPNIPGQAWSWLTRNRLPDTANAVVEEISQIPSITRREFLAAMPTLRNVRRELFRVLFDPRVGWLQGHDDETIELLPAAARASAELPEPWRGLGPWLDARLQPFGVRRSAADLLADWPEFDPLWALLHRPATRWLQPAPAERDRSLIEPAPEADAPPPKGRPALPPPFEGMEAWLSNLLDRRGVALIPLDDAVRLGTGVRIEDGFIKLRRRDARGDDPVNLEGPVS